jgi:hypothetical protein
MGHSSNTRAPAIFAARHDLEELDDAQSPAGWADYRKMTKIAPQKVTRPGY